MPAPADLFLAEGRIIFLCRYDRRHKLGRLIRVSVDVYPEIGRIGRGPWWSDGKGNVVNQGRGLNVLADDHATAPLGLEGHCKTCHSRGLTARPQISWGRAIALLDDACASSATDTRVVMDW